MMPSILSTSQIQQLGWVLIHSLWQFALVACLAWLAGNACRQRSATLRYSLYLIALCALVLAPIVTCRRIATESVSQSTEVSGTALEDPVRDAQAFSIGATSPQTASAELAADVPLANSASAQRLSVNSETSTSASGEVSRTSITSRLELWLPAIVTVWWAGIIAFACRPVFGWYFVRRLRHIGVSDVPGSVKTLLADTARKLGLRRAVSVWHSTLIQAPIVVGYFKPVVLLPLSIVSELTFGQLEAIIAHELAHVRRHDYLVNLLQTLVETVFFYHPAVWWLSHQIRVEREHCCDDIAVAALGNRVEYGRALLALEELRGAQLALVLGASGGSLVERVRRLLAVEQQQRSSPLPGITVLFLLLGAGVMASLGLNGDRSALAENPEQKAEAPKTEAPTDKPAADQTSKTATTSKLATPRPAELPDELQKKFYEWDKTYRHQSEEQFLEFENEAEALVKHVGDEQLKGRIYAWVAHVAGQSMITKHVERVRKFARKALELIRDPLQRSYMFSLLGSTYEIDPQHKLVADRRRLAAEQLLTGYAELLKYDIPKVAPELPAVGKFDRSLEDPAELEKAKRISAAQVAARKQAEYVRDLVQHRDILANQLRWLYHPDTKVHGRGPDGPLLLRELAAKKLADPAAVDTLLLWVTAVNPSYPGVPKEALTAPPTVLDKLVSMDFTSESLHEALELLLESAGGTLNLDAEGLKSVGATKNLEVSAKGADMSLRNALKLLLTQAPDVAFMQIGKTVFVSSKDRIKAREAADQAAKDSVLKVFAGDWRLYAEGPADQIDPKFAEPKTDIRFRVTGAEVLRMKDWNPFGCGTLDVDLTTTPPGFVMQFKDPGGDAGFLRGTYQIHDDGSLWLTVLGPYQQRGTFIEVKGDSKWTMLLRREKQTSSTEPRKAAKLEFRIAANAADASAEPRVPKDVLQKHYRDATDGGAGNANDTEFAWFSIADKAPTNIDLPVMGTIGKLRKALLSDLPEHTLLATKNWKVVHCEVVPGEGSSGSFNLSVRLDESGGAVFKKFTQAHINQKLAIVVDGTIIAAPVIRDAIGGEFVITGKFSREEAEKLANAIRE